MHEQESDRGTTRHQDENKGTIHRAPKRRRFLMAATCCLIALITIAMAIPSARVAVLGSINAWFSQGAYPLPAGGESIPAPQIENTPTPQIENTPTPHESAVALSPTPNDQQDTASAQAENDAQGNRVRTQLNTEIPLQIESVITDADVEYYKKDSADYGKASSKSKYHPITRSMDGARLVVESIRKRFSDTEFTLALYFPEGWDTYDWHGLRYQLCFEYIVGDQAMTPLFGIGDYDGEENMVRIRFTDIPISYGDWGQVDGVTIQLHYYPILPGFERGITLEDSQIPIEGARVTIPSP